MIPEDIIKAVPELSKIVGIIVGGVPVAEIVKAILVPPAQALGRRMADRVDRLFEKTAKMIEDAGVAPQPVEDKIVVEILRGASLEDNEDLHTMWAALLANAASAESAGKVRPGFIATLRQMAPDETTLLNWIYSNIETYRATPLQTAVFPLKELFTDLAVFNSDLRQVRVCLSRLEANGLVTRTDTDREQSFVFQSEHNESNFSTGFPFFLTCAGIEFVTACRPPKPKE
jgi:hypothetical protein